MSRRRSQHTRTRAILEAIGWLARFPDGFVTSASVARHVRHSGVSPRTVDETLARLVVKGWLERDGQRFTPTRRGRLAISRMQRGAGL